MGCAWLVFLADCATAYVVFRKFLHSFAFIGLAKEVGRVRDPGVAGEWVVMIQSQDFASLFEFFRELELGEACGRE